MEGSSSVKIFGTICVLGPQCTPSHVTFPEEIWEIEYFGYGSDSHWKSDMSGHTKRIFHMHINICACNKGNMLWFEVGLKDRGGMVFCHRMVEATFRVICSSFWGDDPHQRPQEVLIDGRLSDCWRGEQGCGCWHYWPALASDRARQTWPMLLNDDLALRWTDSLHTRRVTTGTERRQDRRRTSNQILFKDRIIHKQYTVETMKLPWLVFPHYNSK